MRLWCHAMSLSTKSYGHCHQAGEHAGVDVYSCFVVIVPQCWPTNDPTCSKLANVTLLNNYLLLLACLSCLVSCLSLRWFIISSSPILYLFFFFHFNRLFIVADGGGSRFQQRILFIQDAFFFLRCISNSSHERAAITVFAYSKDTVCTKASFFRAKKYLDQRYLGLFSFVCIQIRHLVKKKSMKVDISSVNWEYEGMKISSFMKIRLKRAEYKKNWCK